jgi:hypothetical protein
MQGERNLEKLLSFMEPKLEDGIFVFCPLAKDAPVPDGLNIQVLCREPEGTTLILRREEAERANLPFEFPCRQIMLTIYSALDAVGFMAAVAGCLAEAGISVNPISAFYHDHLFVAADQAEDAYRLLKEKASSGENER